MPTSQVHVTAQPAGGLRRLLQYPARLLLKLGRWQVLNDPPVNIPKHVLIGAFHTTNMDGIWLVIFAIATNYHVNFMMKDSLMKGPLLGPLMRWFGAVAIDRSISHNTVEAVAQAFAARDRMALAISPEGTRKKTEFWRSGFYYIAQQAEVPLILASIDYVTREIRFSEPFMVTGDVEADLTKIRAFYEGATPRHPEKAGPIRFRSSQEES